MRNFLFLLFTLTLVLTSCKDKKHFKLDFKTPADNLKIGKTLEVEVVPLTDKTIDSIAFQFQKKSDVTTNSIQLPLKDVLLGKHNLSLKIYADDEMFEMTQPLKVFNNKPPKILSYEVVNAYPHDIKAYTQGLEFYQDTLYESIGHYGKSELRKVDFETGKILKSHQLKDHYFGEGLTILNDKIYQLTWREGEGLIYDVNSFEVLDKFRYDKSEEGWGLCHDENYIYKSDGTDKIWRLNPETLEEIDYIQPTTHNSISEKLNELEYVNGKIYANTYQKDGVAIINPQNGAIEAVVDFRKLKKQVRQHSDLDVLNGIAYHSKTKKLYVTGKNWNKLFEVKVISK
ncbi:glutaminyl-peptide cyclotransferase [Flavobacteriaceae bacterium 14752]|uniref:glutaminyl-peptide cyclotransferase n=1 Tax=Mesohalobacter salilacus TaxID=2491711 RepID=UPI000F63E2D4|nr:glutaminyl-peptide cyclotransferase [Flavobacteriaceae bacterium 14752]